MYKSIKIYTLTQWILYFQVYLHDVSVSADVWEAVDTERRGPRAKTQRGRVGGLLMSSLLEEKGNCTCLANLLHYIMDIFLTCEKKSKKDSFHRDDLTVWSNIVLFFSLLLHTRLGGLTWKSEFAIKTSNQQQWKDTEGVPDGVMTTQMLSSGGNGKPCYNQTTQSHYSN